MRKLAMWLIGVFFVLLSCGALFLLIGPRYGWSVDAVLSGSMEPALAVGSIEVTKPLQINDDVDVGDIITFRSPSDANVVISHRVIAIAGHGFITKGDANRVPDEFVVPRENVLGKVVFHIPYLGYLVWVMKTPLGFFLLLVPAILLIALSVINLRDVEKDSLG